MGGTRGVADDSSRAVGVRDVAAEAGVSIGTVSNVINNPEIVGESTRRRVEKAMDDLGFVGSRAAGQLRSRRSRLIGVVVPDVGNPYWASVLRGVETVADSRNLGLVVGSTRQDPDRQKQLLRAFRGQGVDGLIIAPIAAAEADWRPFELSQYGVVTLERPRTGSTVAWVGLDNVEGARLAFGHLLDLGHRKIAMVNGPPRVSWCAERREGALRAVLERGLSPAETIIDVWVKDLTMEEGAAAIGPVLDEGDLTAVMCVNDLLALGALLAMREREITVPSEIALVGFDDADFAPALNPSLTTVHQPSLAMGIAAAELLFEKRAPGAHVDFEPHLVVRESSGASR